MLIEIERFMSYVEPVTESGCWIWTGGLNPGGYGKFWVAGKTIIAHRYSYQFFVGEIEDRQVLDHLCRVRCCVNPYHLEPVSQRENILRGIGGAALNAGVTVCINGHPLSQDNTYVWVGETHKHGMRRCKECNRNRARLWYQRKHGLALT